MSCIYKHVCKVDENPAMTLQDIKETKHYGRTHGHTDARTDGQTDNVKTVYPPQTKFAGGIIKPMSGMAILNEYMDKALTYVSYLNVQDMKWI